MNRPMKFEDRDELHFQTTENLLFLLRAMLMYEPNEELTKKIIRILNARS